MRRTGAAASHQGYFHETARFGSARELVDIALPFLLDGVAAGEPTVVAVTADNAAAIRAALPDPAGVEFLPRESVYNRPALTIATYRALLAERVREGAGQIRILGELPAAGPGTTWDWWARYEAAINRAYDEFPLWSICAYDTRTTPEWVLDAVERTHPRIATADGGHRLNPDFLDPVTFLGHRTPIAPDPLQLTAPLLDLADPPLATVRDAIRHAHRTGLDRNAVEDLTTAVSEVAANALRHGKPPVRVRLWSDAERIVVTVTDQGSGPADPFTGLLPAAHAPNGGLGLWLSFQLCDHVTFGPDENGFTVRLIAGPTRT